MKKFRLLVSLMMLVVSFAVFSGCGAEETYSGAYSKVNFSQFSTRDLNGNEVTQEIFAGKKLTVINVWGTFCPPCIGEMPALGKLSRDYADRDTQVIGLVIDISGENDKAHIDYARKVVTEANADFVNIYPDQNLRNALKEVDAVPTTFFVDSQGKLVGVPVIGADVEQYREFMENYLK
ncbi:MAG TPA: TlpA family protein disulfide reductase [Selenomonas sp.]|nr:TlpA family protein disulfide reductase [Selenomonas sp.]